MTAIQFVEYVLENNWSEDGQTHVNDGSSLPLTFDREHDVPYPKVVRESDANQRRLDDSRQDYAILKDGGITQIEGRSVGGTEQRLVSIVDVELRTTGEAGKVPGRERLWGHRDENNDAESYGGLANEALRCIEEEDWRSKEFDLVHATEANDLSNQYGGERWVGFIKVELDSRAIKRYPYS